MPAPEPVGRVVAQWVQKADADFLSALQLLRARDARVADSICFHAQQCVEKYLKGVLQAEGVGFVKTHDLCLLLDACVVRHPLWEAYRGEFEMLTQYAVQFRYPGEAATRAQARSAIEAMTRLRRELRAALSRLR